MSIRRKSLLERAEKALIQGLYADALQSYGLLLKDYPSLEEAKIGVYVSDLGLENPEEAQAIFDYYQVIKDEKEDAVETILNLIQALDSSKGTLDALLKKSLATEVEYSDGIRYHDFLEIIESRGSFKEAFEDIMFSTKVVITDKEEFIDFVTHLAQEGFSEMALGYLDSASGLFGEDQEVLALYGMVQGEKV